jgi:predicted glycosyltransferase
MKAMNIIFVVGHPAHVHLFKNSIEELRKRGHSIKIISIKKEITEKLLTKSGYEYEVIGSNYPTVLGKLVSTVTKDMRLIGIAKTFEPDILVSTGIPYASHTGKMRDTPSIAFSDTEIAKLVLYAMAPFASAICTPSCFELDLGDKHIKYNGYHEIAYLHPKYFTPDPSVLDMLDVSKDEKITVIRISSWDSSHDVDVKNVNKTHDTLLEAVRRLGEHSRIFLTSEIQLPKDLEKHRLNIPIDRIHDLLYYATLYIGEGATMASEAGVLGTPWIFISSQGRGYLEDQEKNYGLGYTMADPLAAFDKGIELLNRNNLKSEWQKKREKLLKDKIDVTEFITTFIENWPDSFEGAKSKASNVGDSN